jgi:hypothetical protein
MLPACLACLLMALSACGSKAPGSFIQDAHYVEEDLSPVPCAALVASLTDFLEQRSAGRMLGGRYTREAELPEGECGRFVIHSSLSNAPDAVVLLLPEGREETRMVIYQSYANPVSRRFALTLLQAAAPTGP